MRINQEKITQVLRAIIVGMLSGLVVSTFRFLIEHLLEWIKWCYGLMHFHPALLIIWTIGSISLAVILGLLVKNNPTIKGSGIPQVEGQLTSSFYQKWWSVLWQKFIGGVLAIGSGLFLGREGPSIQLGASVGQGVAQLNHEDTHNERILIASGAAAGLSAAFNAPIASTMFILEEVYHNFSPIVWLSSLVSAIAANFVSMNFFGLTPVLHLHYSYSLPIADYGHLLILGVILGLAGRLYQISLLKMPMLYKFIKNLKPQFWPIIPFLLVIPIGWYWPSILGGGNSIVVELGVSHFSIAILALMLILRFIFSMISYGSELPGGIFLPILTLGALLGGLYAEIMVHFGFLQQTLVVNFIIYAMAGYFACISKAPFTAILLIAEMVGSLAHLMPLAVVSVTAYLVVDWLHGAPIYESLFNAMVTNQPSVTDDALEILSVAIFADSDLDRKLIKDFDWPLNSLVYSIDRNGHQILPHGNTKIKAGDTLLVSMPKDQINLIMPSIRNAAGY